MKSPKRPEDLLLSFAKRGRKQQPTDSAGTLALRGERLPTLHSDSLDPLQAAPAHHDVLLEDERVRVIRTHIPAGDTVPLHTHRWGGVAHLLSWSDFVCRDHEGNVLFDSRLAGDPPSIPAVQWMQPLPPHTVENVGSSEIRILIVELKDRQRS